MKSLDALLSPRRIAVVGASANPRSIGGQPVSILREAGFKGTVYPVNPRYTELNGERCYPDLLSPPDGYNILLGGAANAIDVAALAKVPFDLQRDLAPVVLCVKGANVLSIHPSLPAKNLKELIALAKARSAQLNYGTSGVASSNHMAAELFTSMAAIKLNHVPYKGNAPALTDLIGGHLEMMISGVPALIPHIKSGRIRSVAIGSPKRFAAIPDVPTFDEQGLKGYEASTWFGFMVPAKTPREIVAKLNTETGKILASKEIRERYQTEGLEPQGGTPESFAQFIAAEIALYTRVVKAANLPKL